MPRLFRTMNERRSDLIQEQCWNIGLAVAITYATASCGIMAMLANQMATEAGKVGNDAAALKFTILTYTSFLGMALGIIGIAGVSGLVGCTVSAAQELEQEERRMMFDAN